MSVQEFPRSLRPPVRQPFPWRVLLIGFGLATILVLAGVVRGIRHAADDQARWEAFNPHVQGWIDQREGADGTLRDAPPALRGELVVVDGERRAVWPWFMHRVDQRFLAATPRDVGTVVLCDIEWRRAGSRTDAAADERGGPAWHGWLHVTLLDPARGEVLGRRSFEGPRPVTSTLRDGDQAGGLPVWDVLAWLHGLPRN